MLAAPSSLASNNCKRHVAPTEPVSVRVATPDDAPRLAPLLARALSGAAQRGGATRRSRLFGGNGEHVTEELLGPHGPMILVAEQGVELLGIAVLDLEVAALLAVYVEPAARRRGVGSALVTLAASRVGAEGRSITALVSAGDRAEKSLFEHLGYRAELLVMAPREST